MPFKKTLVLGGYIWEQKLIFLDIYGTLTEPGKNIPPASAVEAVCRARKNGHKVVLCSGRNYGLLSPLLQFGFDGFISSAGGYIEYGGNIVYDCPMTRAQQDRVLKVLQENGVYYIIETRNHSYSDESFKEFLKNGIRSDANSELLRWQKHIESVSNAFRTNSISVSRMKMPTALSTATLSTKHLIKVLLYSGCADTWILPKRTRLHLETA